MRTMQTIKADFEKMIKEYPDAQDLLLDVQCGVLDRFKKQIESAKFAVGDIVNVHTDSKEILGAAYIFAIGIEENKICYHLKKINKNGGSPPMAWKPEAYEKYLEPYQAND